MLLPSAAYRLDASSGPLSRHDDRWLTIALLAHARQLATAGVQATQLVGTARIAAYAKLEWRDKRHRLAPLLVLADAMHEANGHHLGARLLDDLLGASPRLAAIWKGRILALRARFERRLGRLDDAADRYDYLYSLGVRNRLPELKARAEIGRVALTQTRGNLPAVHKHSLLALGYALKSKVTGVTRLAFQGITIASASKGDHEGALTAGWRVVRLSAGFPTEAAEALQNLGQAMLVAGQFELARSAFSAVLARSTAKRPLPNRLLLNALGGLTLASARLRIESTVEWSVREVWRASSLAMPRWELAQALLESAAALQLIGRSNDSERYRARARDIATESEFHEIAFRADALAADIATARPSVLTRETSESIAERLHQLGDRLPRPPKPLTFAAR